MKRILFTAAFAIFITLQANAQFSVVVNGKSASQGQTINLADLKTMTVSFANAKKIPEYTTGRGALYVDIKNAKGDLINQWAIKVDGYTAVEDLLYPKTAKIYTVWTADNSKPDLAAFYESQNLARIYKDAYGNTESRQLTLTVNLSFEEKLTYNSYGSQVFLLDKFSINLDVWSKTNTINLDFLNANFEFKEELLYDSYDTDREGSDLASFGTPIGYNINFDDKVAGNVYAMRVRLVKVTSDQQTELNNLKTSFENYLSRISNLCNGEKILKTIPADDGKEWKEITGFMQGPAAYGNQAQWNSIYLPLDQKLNKDTYKNATIFETVSLGNLQGFRFKGLKSSVKCKEGGLLSGFASKTDDEYIGIAGNDVIYLLKHPTNPSIVLLINASSKSEQSTQDGLNKKAAMFESFLSALNFK